jgi:hypothetical protein
VLRGAVELPLPAPVRALRPRISIAATVWLMVVLLMLLKSGMIQPAAKKATIKI